MLSTVGKSRFAFGAHGFLQVSTPPASARVKFRDGRLGDVGYATEIPSVIAGSSGTPTTFALEAEILALSRTGALAVELFLPYAYSAALWDGCPPGCKSNGAICPECSRF